MGKAGCLAEEILGEKVQLLTIFYFFFPTRNVQKRLTVTTASVKSCFYICVFWGSALCFRVSSSKRLLVALNWASRWFHSCREWDAAFSAASYSFKCYSKHLLGQKRKTCSESVLIGCEWAVKTLLFNVLRVRIHYPLWSSYHTYEGEQSHIIPSPTIEPSPCSIF